MRVLHLQTAVIASVLLLAQSGFAALRSCSSDVRRDGDHVSTSMSQLSRLFNQKLKAVHSHFSDLQLVAQGKDTLKVSAKNDGQPISIGPGQATSSGGLRLHAKQITRNGTNLKGLMGFFGQKLDDHVDLQDSPSLTVHGNDLDINLERLLGLSGRITNIQLHGSRIQMQFASKPCR